MSQTALPNLGINYDWEAGEDGWKDGMDLNLLMLDAFGQAVVVSQVNADPWVSSSSPSPGKMYIVGTSPTGATAPWDTASAATIANKLAIATGNNAGVNRWHMVTPKDGWTVYNQATKQRMSFRGTHGSNGRWVNGDSGIPNVSSSTVLSLTLATPPGSPAAGDAYIVGSSGTGAWSAHDEEYAQYNGSSWEFTTPVNGMKVRLSVTGEGWIYDGSNWGQELGYLISNSRGATTVNCGNSGVGPFSADRAAPSYTLSRSEASTQVFTLGDASMLGSIDFTNTPGGTAISGNGTLSDFSVTGDNAPEETWTLTCTAPGATATFSVVGSVSGAQANATVGTPYDNGIIAFTLNDGSTDFTNNNSGNADQIVFTVAEMPILIAATETDVVPAMTGVTFDSMAAGGYSRCKISGGDGSTAWVTLRQTDGFDLLQFLPQFNAALSLAASNYSHKVSAPLRSSGTPTKTANYTITPADGGSSIIMDTTGGNLTLTIPDSPAVGMGDCCVLRIFHKGGNTLTIAGAGGVTLTGTTSGTSNKFLTLQRDGTSNTWYCG